MPAPARFCLLSLTADALLMLVNRPRLSHPPVCRYQVTKYQRHPHPLSLCFRISHSRDSSSHSPHSVTARLPPSLRSVILGRALFVVLGSWILATLTPSLCLPSPGPFLFVIH